jgi:N-acetylglucosaminyldiphosphoundecaprenol N-acetyl-beta-D-mannosaminyltransferase
MKKNLLGLPITIEKYEGIVERICCFAKRRQSSYCCVANVHMLIEAQRSRSLHTAITNADVVTADGMPLVKSLKLLYGITQDRIAGMDLLPDLLRQCNEMKIAVYFYGSTPAIIQKTNETVKNCYPGIIIAGSYSPPFRDLTKEEENEVINNINESKAQLIFVALGCPKQEKWMAAMKGRLQASMIGIGGALPVFLGVQKRAPKWMQKNCLEWLFRFKEEPRRLFKRYAITNSVFIFLLIKNWILLKFNPKARRQLDSQSNNEADRLFI